MMNLRNHIIDRQLLEVSFQSRQQAVQHQQEISRICHNKLLPLIDLIFTRSCQGHEHIRIESIELDLGNIPPSKIEETLIDRLRQLLPDALMKKIRDASHGSGSTIDPRSTSPSTHAAVRHAAQTVSSVQSDLEVFIYFVEHGRMPWWAAKRTLSDIRQLVTRLVQEQPTAMAEALRVLIVYPDHIHRITYQLPDVVLRELVSLLQPKQADVVYNLNLDLYAVHHHRRLIPVSVPEFRITVWEHAFQYCAVPQKEIPCPDGYASADVGEPAGDDEQVKPQGIAASHRTFSPDAYRYTLSLMKKLAYRAGEENNLPVFTRQALECIRVLSGRKHPFRTASLIAVMKAVVKECLRSARSKVRVAESKDDALLATPKEVKKKPDAARIAEDERLEIGNAGLVLLWPFLTAFFEGIGLTKDKTFVTEDAARRGALLLQYMVTADTEMAEHELILNKLLCGLAIDEPLPAIVEPTATELEEMEHLLNTVANRWQALKGASGDALRRTFLIKNGLLSTQTNGWKLQIERSAVDMLLDKLPWSIGIVRLPWSKQILFVEW